jgi:predicted phage terminase large subunit-like protein
MGALQYVDTPGYAAILFRRTYSELTLPEALMDRANEWLYPFIKTKEIHWSKDEKTYTFPSGATLSFGYLDTGMDHFRYQSSAFQYIGFDELTHFEQSDYTYLFSRARRTKALQDKNVPIRVRAGSNPGGPGHDWVKQRFLVEGAEKGRIFIPAIMYDNIYLDTDDYLESLNELDPVVREQLLKGDWAITGGGKILKREWFEIIESLPNTQAYLPRVRYWDLAATDANISKAYGYKPAYTVGLKMAKIGRDFYIEDVQRFQKTPDGVEAEIKRVAKEDGIHTEIWMETEPGSAGINNINYYQKVLQGFTFRGQKESGSKVLRANATASTAGQGRVKLIRGAWNTAFLDEVDFFPEGKIKDQVDAFSGAFDKLNNFASYSVLPTAVGQESNSYWESI